MAKVDEEWLAYPVIPYETTDALAVENKQLVVSIKQHVLSCDRDIAVVRDSASELYRIKLRGTVCY